MINHGMRYIYIYIQTVKHYTEISEVHSNLDEVFVFLDPSSSPNYRESLVWLYSSTIILLLILVNFVIKHCVILVIMTSVLCHH